jgi:CIC family chloride channel protein
MITSILTVGFGGSAGLEAPIASTGSAIGSLVARRFGFGTKERILLLACGAAAGISAIFNAPIAGVIFALEILLVDMPLPVVVPILISSATAALFSRFIFSGQPFVLITNSWNAGQFHYYIAFAILCAFISVLSKKIYFVIEDFSLRINKPYLKALGGGLTLGLFIFIVPQLFGEGYDSVQLLLQNHADFIKPFWNTAAIGESWSIVLFAVLLVFFKVIATSITVGSGGNGGMFGSSLFMGAMLGFAFSRTINILGIAELNEINFIVIGMAVLMSGIIHSPLTAIFDRGNYQRIRASCSAHDCLFNYLSHYTILYSTFCIHEKTCVKRRSSRCEQRSCCPESNETFPLCREKFQCHAS